MADLQIGNPTPHFGLTTFAEADDRYVARVVVQSEEVAAILDGLVLSEPAVTIELLRMVMGEVARQIHYDFTDESDGWIDDMQCADDAQILAARLPLAARIHKYLMVEREHGSDLSIAVREGWSAEIRELFVGKIPGFAISGEERDALVREVRAALKRLDGEEGYKRTRRELEAILRDTGEKKGTGEACTLSTLAMPALVEWLRIFGPGVTSAGFHQLPKKQRRKRERRHGLIRDMWKRLRREVTEGPKGRVS